MRQLKRNEEISFQLWCDSKTYTPFEEKKNIQTNLMK